MFDKREQLKTQQSPQNIKREKTYNNIMDSFLSARYETKDITYQNRIFNVKKKFTVPNYHNDFYRQRKTQISNQKKHHPKPSQMFSKHLDNIIKNRRLLRRNIWQLPFKAQCITNDKGRNRYKTQVDEQSKQKQKIVQIVKNRKRVTQSTRYLQQQKKCFPRVRNSMNDIELPIKLQTRYGSKSISSKMTQVDEQVLKSNALSRKLAVQLINYNLLGKWASSSLKNN